MQLRLTVEILATVYNLTTCREVVLAPVETTIPYPAPLSRALESSSSISNRGNSAASIHKLS